MESITLGQIAGAIGTITAIAVFFIAIFKWYKKTILDKFRMTDERLERLEQKSNEQDREIEESKSERLILLKGQLACLKGLKEQGCNGPVTQAINDIENYLISKSHE